MGIANYVTISCRLIGRKSDTIKPTEQHIVQIEKGSTEEKTIFYTC